MRIDRLLSLALAIALLLSGTVASASFTLPTGLTLIETEAFMGDESVAGLVRIPAGVKYIGVDAFTGTGLFALDLSGDVTQMGDQSGLDAAYLRLRGKATAVGEVSPSAASSRRRAPLPPSWPASARACALYQRKPSWNRMASTTRTTGTR